MAKQTSVLDKSFTADTAINRANVCVVMSGTNAGNVRLPGTSLATRFVGVVREPADNSLHGNAVSVQLAGIAQIESDGSAAIAAGDYVAIGNTSGQVRTIVPATGTNSRQIVGMALSGAGATAGLLVDVLLMPGIYIGA